jgi:hypothetical protein
MLHLLTIAYRIPPLLVAIVLALVLIAVASSRGWRWPMLLESALIVCFATRPSVQLLTFGMFLAALRWVPPFAAVVAQALNVPSWGGLSLPVALFALPGLHAYVRGTERHERTREALPPVVVATGRTTRLEQPQAIHARPLAPAEWLRACNDDPTAPHLGIVGPTQHGKTTFALALIGRRPGDLVITTTKDDAWAGAEVIRPSIQLGEQKGIIDWAPIAEAVRRVHFEMLRRNVQHDTSAPPLTLVIDEFTTTLGNISRETRDQIVEIWSMGASCGVRMIVIAQEVNARAWGLEGRRDVLNNLLFARVETGRLWTLGRLDPNGGLLSPCPLDTHSLVALAAEAQLMDRGWAGLVAPGAPPGDGVGVPVPPVGVTPSPTSGNGTNGTGNGNDELLIAALMKLRGAGVTREQARAMGLAFRDENWTKAGERIGTGIN